MLYDGEKQKEGATDMYLKTLDIHTAYTLEPAKLDLYLLDLSEKFADRERPLVLICPGGIPGTPNLAACPALTKQLVKFQEEGKEVAAICAAPSILADLGLLRGKTAACNPSKEDVLRAGGANLVFAPVAEDGNIITSRAMGTAVPFGLKIVEHYRGREFAESLRKTILFAEEG